MAPLTPGRIATAADLFAKLKRDAALLADEVTSDRLFNFTVTGYSLIDWVKHDPAVPIEAKQSRIVEALYKDEWLRVCGDIATAAKHFTLLTRRPITEQVESQQGFGVGRYGSGPFGVGEEQIVIQLSDGSAYSALQLVDGVMGTWARYFDTHTR